MRLLRILRHRLNQNRKPRETSPTLFRTDAQRKQVRLEIAPGIRNEQRLEHGSHEIPMVTDSALAYFQDGAELLHKLMDPKNPVRAFDHYRIAWPQPFDV